MLLQCGHQIIVHRHTKIIPYDLLFFPIYLICLQEI